MIWNSNYIGAVTLAVPSRFSVISRNTENQLTRCQEKGTTFIKFLWVTLWHKLWQNWHITHFYVWHTFRISCCFRLKYVKLIYCDLWFQLRDFTTIFQHLHYIKNNYIFFLPEAKPTGLWPVYLYVCVFDLASRGLC